MLISLLLPLALAGATGPDSLPTFSDAATRELVMRGIARHASQDTLVSDYQARFRYRLSFGFGKGVWERVLTAAVEEQEGNVHWQRPNDLKVDILGRRSEARRSEFNISSIFDRPWFVPRQVGDSVRAFGQDFPQRAALHPLAADGPQWYRYAIVDSLTVRDPSGTEVRLRGVRVMPVRPGAALVAGTLWFDLASAEVVRFSFRFLGGQVWVDPDGTTHEDTVDARKANKIISQVLTLDADLQYALQEGKYWMPYRQILSGRVVVPFFGNIVIPFETETRFEDYQINSGAAIAFAVPLPDTTLPADSVQALERARRDSIRADRRKHDRSGDDGHDDAENNYPREWAGRWPGGRYEIHRAPNDSLKQYAEWGDSLVMDRNPGDAERIREVEADLAKLSDQLPSDITGVPRHGIPLEKYADIVRYNRVQGVSLGLDYRWRPEGWAFSRLEAGARFGIADARPLGRLGLVRDAPSGRLSVWAFHDLLEPDPFSRGRTLSNTINATFSAHDEADYYLATGATIGFDQSLRRGLNWSITGGVEWQQSVSAIAHSAVNDFLGGDGQFPDNPPVTEGTYAVGSTRLDGDLGRARWSLGVSGIAGSPATGGHVFGQWIQRIGGRRGLTLRLRSGIASDPDISQLGFRAGGLESVRGFDYGTQRGQAYWALQSDFTPFKGWFKPVFFADAGQAARPADFGGTNVLVGAGIGLSLIDGLIRFDFSHPITPSGGGLRFDLVIRGAR
ncbi:MAG TPA: hypothetical protein VJN95_17140 [Gemmatimonadales bacterium]|nr:hypothetical protein [Gemmatimonadales bacterium]